MARMSIDDKFPRDPRVIKLGRRLGWSRRETMGALIDVYQVAYDREQDVLPAEDIEIAAEREGFVAAMIECDLAEQMRDSVRIRGAAERIAYLSHKAQAGKIGGVKSGESRRNRREAKRSSASEADEARGNPPDPVPDPAPDPVPEDQISLSACARPPDPEPASPAQSFAAKDLARHRALGDLAEATWTRLSTLRTQHASKLGLEGTLPFPAITPGSVPRAFDELRARLREEGDNARTVADHVIRVLDEQARTAKSIEWLSEKAFLERPWSKARETVLAKRKPPAAAPATPPVFMASDDDRAAAAAELAAFLGKETA